MSQDEVDSVAVPETKNESAPATSSPTNRGTKSSRGRGFAKSNTRPESAKSAEESTTTEENNTNNEASEKKRPTSAKKRDGEPRKYESVAELEKKIGELTVVPKPDDSKLNKKIEDLTKKIEEAQELLARKRGKLEEQQKSGQKFATHRQELYDKINDSSEKIKAKHREKDNVNNGIVQLEQEYDEVKKKLDAMQKDLQFTEDIKIDNRIKELEKKLTTETHDMRTEKGLVGQIAKLNKSKDAIKDFQGMRQGMNSIQDKIKELRGQIRGKQEEIDALKKERESVKEELTKLNQQTNAGDRKQLKEDSNKLRDQIKEYYKGIEDAKQEARDQGREYRKYEKSLSDLRFRLDKQKQYERKQKEREEREKDKERRQKEREEYAKQWEEYNDLKKQNPYEVEIGMCDALIVYLEKLQKSSANKLKKKESLGGDITSKQQRNQSKKNTQLTINHPIDKFQAFSTLGVELPTTIPKIDAALQTLRRKKKEYKQATPSEASVTNHADFAEEKEITKVKTTATVEIEEEQENSVEEISQE